MYRSEIGQQHEPHRAASTADIAAAAGIDNVSGDDVVWHFISTGTETNKVNL